MTQLACKTVVPIDHLAVNHDAAAHARTERNHNEVLHSFGGAVGHLAHCGCVRIVGNGAWQTELLLHHLGKRNILPRQVHCAFYSAGVVVAVRYTRSDTAKHIQRADRRDDFHRLIIERLYIDIDVLVVLCLDAGAT